MVLGIQWLKGISPVCFDFNRRVVRFNWKGKEVALSQDKEEQKFKVQIEDTKKWNSRDESYFLVHLSSMEENHKDGTEIPSQVRQLV